MRGLPFLFVLLAPHFAFAQSDRAELTGIVYDQTRAVLPGVSITITKTSTGFERQSVSDAVGRFRLPVLPPGEYTLRAELPGYAVYVRAGIVLAVGSIASADITLEVAARTESVVVNADAEIVQPGRTDISLTIREEQIDNLPINGRNFLDFALLTPGVAAKQTTATTLVSTPTSGLSFAGQDERSNYVTIDGFDNMDIQANSVRPTLSQEAIQEFQVERSSFSAELGRGRAGVINIVSKSGTNLPRGNAFVYFRDRALDARDLFSVDSSGRSIKPPFRRQQWGGTLSGPIRRDRTFYFGSFESLHRKESVYVRAVNDSQVLGMTASQKELFGVLGTSGVPLLQSLAKAFSDPQTGILNTTESTFPETMGLLRRETGTFPRKANSVATSFKLDHQFSGADQFWSRIQFNDSKTDSTDFGGLKTVSNGVNLSDRNFSIGVSETHVLSPVAINAVRFQYARFKKDIQPNDKVTPEIIIAGVAHMGRDFLNPTYYTERTLQAADDFTWIKGRHKLKAGFDWIDMHAPSHSEVFLGGQFTFLEALPLGLIIDSAAGAGTAGTISSTLAGPLGRADLAAAVSAPITALQSYNFGLPVFYLQGFGDPDTTTSNTQVAAYIQDTWNPLPNLTLNIGLRYDRDFLAKGVVIDPNIVPFQRNVSAPRDANNFAPRMGISFDPKNNGRTVVRAGYGTYYQNVYTAATFVSRVLSGQISQVLLPITGIPGLRATSIDFWNYFQRNRKVDSNALTSLAVPLDSTPSVILALAAGSVNPYSQQGSLGLERKMGADSTLEIDYMFNHGVHILRQRDANLRKVATGRFASMDPRYLQVNLLESSGSSIYHGMTASFVKRLSSNYSAMAAYTVSKAIDDVTDFNIEAADNTNLKDERGLSTFDQRHRLVISAVLKSSLRHPAARGWTLAPIVTWASGRPFNLIAGADTNGDNHSDSDRALRVDGSTVGRNTGIGPRMFVTDLRLQRSLALTEETAVEVVFEAFNVFNHVNYLGVNRVMGSTRLPDSRVRGSSISRTQPLGFNAAFPARQIQLGARVKF